MCTYCTLLCVTLAIVIVGKGRRPRSDVDRPKTDQTPAGLTDQARHLREVKFLADGDTEAEARGVLLGGRLRQRWGVTACRAQAEHRLRRLWAVGGRREDRRL